MPIQIMVLGCYHMANRHSDIFNLEVADVRTPTKQAELEEVCACLKQFRPTKIALEVIADRPGLISSIFENYNPERLLESRDEVTQIGLRLAHALGHPVVYGINELSDTIDYFPFPQVEQFAQEHQQQAVLEQMFAFGNQLKLDEQKRHQSGTVRELLHWQNTPDNIETEMAQRYMPFLEIGDTEEHPGADLNAMWFLRNAKIFAKLRRIIQADDRILVVFGAGHAYWLRHFAQLTPEFEMIEPNQYLSTSLEFATQ
jgi:Family of unknown function (DUF5694)